MSSDDDVIDLSRLPPAHRGQLLAVPAPGDVADGGQVSLRPPK